MHRMLPRTPAEAPKLERVIVLPTERRLGREESFDLRVTARFSDGSTEDVTHLAAEMKLKVPAALKGVKITWAGAPDTGADQAKEQAMTLARPGVAEAVGLTIGCIKISRFRVCLECGWFYCRVVIKGTF